MHPDSLKNINSTEAVKAWSATIAGGLQDFTVFGEEDEMVDKNVEEEYKDKIQAEQTQNFLSNLRPLLSRVKDAQLILTQVFKTSEEREMLLESLLLILAEAMVEIPEVDTSPVDYKPRDFQKLMTDLARKYRPVNYKNIQE